MTHSSKPNLTTSPNRDQNFGTKSTQNLPVSTPNSNLSSIATNQNFGLLSTQESAVAKRSKSTSASFSPYLRVLQEEQLQQERRGIDSSSPTVRPESEPSQQQPSSSSAAAQPQKPRSADPTDPTHEQRRANACEHLRAEHQQQQTGQTAEKSTPKAMVEARVRERSTRSGGSGGSTGGSGKGEEVGESGTTETSDPSSAKAHHIQNTSDENECSADPSQAAGSAHQSFCSLTSLGFGGDLLEDPQDPSSYGDVTHKNQNMLNGFIGRKKSVKLSLGQTDEHHQQHQQGFDNNADLSKHYPPTSKDILSQHQGDDNGGPANRRWLILMEPINALYASVILGAKGRIFRADDSFANVLGYDCTNRLFGTEIHRLIPALHIDAEWDHREQFCCGYTLKNNGIPFSVVMQTERDSECVAFSYEVQIRSLSSINGVVTITDSGLMYSFNENFLHQLLGMIFDLDGRERYANLEITDVIPHFYEYLEVAQLHLERHRREAESTGVNAPFTPTVSHSTSCLQELATARRGVLRKTTFYSRSATNSVEEEEEEEEETEGGTENEKWAESQQQHRIEGRGENNKRQQQHHLLRNNHPDIIPGIFYGLAKHVDGSLIPVKIEVTNLDMQSQPKLFAVCIGFDRSADYGISQLSESEEQEQQQNSHVGTPVGGPTSCPFGGPSKLNKHAANFSANLAAHSTSGSVDSSAVQFGATRAAKFSIGGSSGFSGLRECDSDSAVDFVAGRTVTVTEHTVGAQEAKLQDVSLDALEDENNEAVRGEYSKLYDTFQLIGNGAFGSVKLAARKDTGLLAVSKFICKSKVLPEGWVPSPKRGNRLVPIEVHLLENLCHPNIVRVLDVFENDKYYQLVMEKLGCGMDLFEFIDHQPKVDEPLMSYIFRQIVSAVDYLHENHIVHRDLKDENVIIDQNFHCKLIDFGSAAFFGENIVFSTFCGTMEYCSPEVLTGNKYLGPELEMWSLGILLYTLAFFENPFRSAQETVQAEIELPWEISEGLYQVLSWLLQPDPKLRATVGEIKRHWWVTQRVDSKQYKFQDILRNCDRAQVAPPLYISDLQNRLKNASSCSNLVNHVAIAATTQTMTLKPQESGVVSAR